MAPGYDEEASFPLEKIEISETLHLGIDETTRFVLLD